MRGDQDVEEAKTPVQVDPKDDSVWDPEEPTFFDIDESDTKMDIYKRNSIKQEFKFEADELSKGR